MKYITRELESQILRSLGRNKSVLLFGARQTGKTTLISRFSAALAISFIQPDVRQRYERSPGTLRAEIEAIPNDRDRGRPLVILDEVQKVPDILDIVQDLIDRRQANFILTGSSARKLRHKTKVNFLPGRVTTLRLDPFTLKEAPHHRLNDYLLYGALPGILAVNDLNDRERDLESYVTSYLEEEVRSEALVRNLGHFARFLEMAAGESGNMINTRKLSQEIGVAHTTIAGYFQILEDCLIVHRIEPLTQSRARKRLMKSEKYLFFDLGVRRAAAREGTRLPRETMGKIFEQFVGLELLKNAHIYSPSTRIRYWRQWDGPEVDWVIDKNGIFTPVEVKWTDNPSAADIKHVEKFLLEYPSVKTGYLICQAPRKLKLSERVTAIPWQSMESLIVQP